MAKNIVVAIDGPAGAGKSSVSALLADRLGGCLIDTGATYRALGYLALTKGLVSKEDLVREARGLSFKIDAQGLWANGHLLGSEIRTSEVSEKTSQISTIAEVREIIVAKQRGLIKDKVEECPVVVEGRDMGTVVVPDADFKFFITASPEVRAMRRFLQLKQKDPTISYEEVFQQQKVRDKRDSSRKVAPLKKAEDAIEIDTSSLSISEVVEKVLFYIQKRPLGRSSSRNE